jgi:hypothetical protein
MGRMDYEVSTIFSMIKDRSERSADGMRIASVPKLRDCHTQAGLPFHVALPREE